MFLYPYYYDENKTRVQKERIFGLLRRSFESKTMIFPALLKLWAISICINSSALKVHILHFWVSIVPVTSRVLIVYILTKVANLH